MIFSNQVREIARAHITEVLSPYPAAARLILDTPRFDQWVQLATQRVNEMDMWLTSKGHVITKAMIVRFVEDCARAFGDEELKRRGEYKGLTSEAEHLKNG